MKYLILCLALVGCQPQKEINIIDEHQKFAADYLSNIEYWEDARTGLCFAIMFNRNFSMTNVPCIRSTNKFSSKE